MVIDYLALTPKPLGLPGAAAGGATAAGAAGAVAGGSNELVGSFRDVFAKTLNDTDQLQKTSQVMSQKLATGEINNVHDVMIAAEKAKIAMQFTLQIRRQLLQAYQSLQQMR